VSVIRVVLMGDKVWLQLAHNVYQMGERKAR
jgi:hypothetical protein